MSLTSSFRQPTCLGALFFARVTVGYYFLKFGWAKLSPRFIEGMGRQISESVARDPLAWHRDFITNFVLPHAHAFAYLVCLGEIAIGISLILGFMVRVSSFFGAFHNANIYFAVALAGGGLQPVINVLFIVLQLTFLFTAAGRAWGLDGPLKKRFPRSPFF